MRVVQVCAAVISPNGKIAKLRVTVLQAVGENLLRGELHTEMCRAARRNTTLALAICSSPSDRAWFYKNLHVQKHCAFVTPGVFFHFRVTCA